MCYIKFNNCEYFQTSAVKKENYEVQVKQEPQEFTTAQIKEEKSMQDRKRKHSPSPSPRQR